MTNLIFMNRSEEMGISRMSSTPLYVQLKNQLQDQILLGELGPGVLLPTEQQLCEKYDLSRITVRRALDELANMDLIERVQGKGSIVKERKVGQSQTKIQGYTKSTKEQGYRPGAKLLEKELITGTQSLLSLFELPKDQDEKFWRFRRLRTLNGDPSVIMNTFVRKELGDRMLEFDLDTESFYALYMRITKRQLIDSRALIAAVPASGEVAELLNTSPGAPLIWFRGVTYTEGNVPIEVNYSLFLGDKYQFETTFYSPLDLDLYEQPL
jgi:GntR family transcriptional regulator